MPTKNEALLEDFLTEYSVRLSFASTSKVLCLDDKISQVFTKWSQSTLPAEQQPQITTADLATALSSGKWPYSEASFTHILTTLSQDLSTSLQGLKQIHTTLLWKGVAIVLPPEEGEVAGEKIDPGKLVDLAGFERGKIRVSERKVKADQGEVEGEVAFAMKWDFLSA